MYSITAHCVIKNEEVYIRYAIQSVIDFVDCVLVYDTGSTDATVEIVKELAHQYPEKIIFEEKGECDKQRHTELRQEMIEKTKTEWFMILDGDEVWTKRALEEAVYIIRKKAGVECIMTPFYLCVGDIYHESRKKGQIEMLGKKDFFYPRFIKITRGVHWEGDYNKDTLLNSKDEIFFNKENSMIMDSHYWHMTHLKRSSSDDNEYSSGGTRYSKRVLTYFLIGKKIREQVPEVFVQDNEKMHRLKTGDALKNFFLLFFKKINLFLD